jgi:hypothetical protein
MILFLLRKCSRKQYKGIKEILSTKKFALISTNREEGVITEITSELNYSELFELYRKFRKKYFKLK